MKHLGLTRNGRKIFIRIGSTAKGMSTLFKVKKMLLLMEFKMKILHQFPKTALKFPL